MHQKKWIPLTLRQEKIYIKGQKEPIIFEIEENNQIETLSEDRELFRNAVKNSIPIKKSNLRINFKSKPKARANQTQN